MKLYPWIGNNPSFAVFDLALVSKINFARAISP